MHKFVIRTLCGFSVIMFAETTLQSMDIEDLRSRYLATNPEGRVTQRDNRLMATVEITTSVDVSEITTKKSWMFTLPEDYYLSKTQVILAAFQDCPTEVREMLEEKKRHFSFTFDIGGSVSIPVIGQAGFPMHRNGIQVRGITIEDTWSDESFLNLMGLNRIIDIFW